MLEQPPESFGGVQTAPRWRGGDPAGDFPGVRRVAAHAAC
jgi:hypothetical protein